MEIKQASTLQTSQRIRNLKISDRVQIGLIVLSAFGWIAYNELPANIQSKVGQYALMGITAGAFTSKLLNSSIKEGVLSVGDLRDNVTNIALLDSPDSALRLKAVSDFVQSGTIPTGEEIRMNLEKLVGDAVK